MDVGFYFFEERTFECGFREVREAEYNDSIYEEFKLVETESRWKNEPIIIEAKIITLIIHIDTLEQEVLLCKIYLNH